MDGLSNPPQMAIVCGIYDIVPIYLYYNYKNINIDINININIAIATAIYIYMHIAHHEYPM